MLMLGQEKQNLAQGIDKFFAPPVYPACILSFWVSTLA